MLTRTITHTLARMRGDRAAWLELATADVRGALLAGLGYGRRTLDIELLRVALEHEIAQHERDGAHADVAQLRLACFLVARARDPADIWRLARAKLANYDTFSALDRELLYAAGIERTAAYVRASAHPDRDGVLAELFDDAGRRWFDDDDLASWWNAIEAYYPANPEDDDPLIVCATALRFGSAAEAVPWLERWAQGDRPAAQHRRAVELAKELAADPEVRSRVDRLDIDPQ